MRTAVASEIDGVVAAEVELVGRDVLCVPGGPGRRASPQARAQFASDGAGDLLLYHEQVLDLSIVGLRPPRRPIRCVHQPDLNAQTRSNLLHTPLQDVRDAQAVRYAPHIGLPVAEGEGRGDRKSTRLNSSH